MKKKCNVYLDIYDIFVDVILVKTLQDLHKEMKQYGYDGEMEDRWLATTFAPEDNRLIVVMLKDRFSPGILAHELYHVVEDYIVPTYNLEGEAKAYLLDFLVEKNSLFFAKEIQIWIDKNIKKAK